MPGRGRPRLLGPGERRRGRELWAQGCTLQRIGAELGCSKVTVRRELLWRSEARQGRVSWEPGGNRLRFGDREEISRGLVVGETFTAIAARLGRPVSAVSREVAANGGRRKYRAVGG